MSARRAIPLAILALLTLVVVGRGLAAGMQDGLFQSLLPALGAAWIAAIVTAIVIGVRAATRR
jgi:uncharacterized protein (DUF2062 family)